MRNVAYAPRIAGVVLVVFATGVGMGCTAGAPGEILDETPDNPPDGPETVTLALEEAGITTAYDADGAIVRVPVRVIDAGDEAGAVSVRLTRLDGTFVGVEGEAALPMDVGAHVVDVRLPGLAPPEDQGEQAAFVLAVDARRGADKVVARRSLYETTPKLGIRVWAPDRIDAGGATQIRVWVTDAKTGDVVSDAAVSALGVVATTDARGQVAMTVTAPDEGGHIPLMIRAVRDGIPVTLSRSVTVVPEGAPRVYLSTDKPLYRPGQTIHIRTLSLRASDLVPVADMPVTIEVLDGKDTKIFKSEAMTDAFGIAALTAPLASQINVGEFQVRATVTLPDETQYTSVLSVQVSEEKLPKYAVTVSLDRAAFAPLEEITGVVAARYFFGQPVVGAEVTLRQADVEGAEVAFTGRTDAEGRLVFTLPGASTGLPLAVRVTDTAGFVVETNAAVAVAEPTVDLTLVPEAPSIPEDVAWTLHVRTTGVLGAPRVADCKVHNQDIVFETDERGRASVMIPERSAAVTCTARGDAWSDGGEVGTGFTEIQRRGVLIRADKAVYEPGERVALTVFGPADRDVVYVDRVHRGRIVETLPVALADGRGEITMVPGADESGILIMTGYFVGGPDEVASGQRCVFVRRDAARVTLTLDKPTYLPGEEAVLTFDVTNAAGVGQPAALGVSIADEAVFALAGGVTPSDVTAFFTLGDQPGAARTFALAEDNAAVQQLAAAAMAGAPSPPPARAFFVDLPAIQAQAYQAFAPHLGELVAALRSDLNRAVERGTITTENGERLIEALVVVDPWGKPFDVVVEVRDYSSSINLKVLLRSRGPDELRDTPDDYETVIQLIVTRTAEELGTWQDASAGANADASQSPSPDFDNDGLLDEEVGPDDGQRADAPKKRDDFPETLYVNPALITDQNGRAQVTLSMADAITRWRVSMVANTADGLVGGAVDGVTVFQDFFVDVDMPRRVTQNDALSLPAGVFNFTDAPIEVTVEIETAPWFTLFGDASRVVTVPAGASLSVPFRIRVDEAGTHALSVTARKGAFNDGVVRTVVVVPDGRHIEVATGGPVDGTVSALLVFPDEAISGGNDALVKIMGGPSGQVLDGVDALLRMPGGCFEPMMNTTWINALVLDYLIHSGSENEQAKATAKQNLDSGFQQCATFECTGGGFTWFGDPDPAHPILTAFALMMLADIDALQDVDPALVSRAQRFLEGQQLEDGSWTTEQSTKEELVPWNDLRASCAVTWGLAASGGADTVVADGVAYIADGLSLDADTYTLAMCANALLAGAPDHAETAAVIEEIGERAVTDGDLVHWESEAPGVTYTMGSVVPVETTALVIQALLALDVPPPTVDGALKYLSSKKSPSGNFVSTQGTIQALRAFVAAAKLAGTETDAQVAVKVGGEVLHSVHIDGSNREVVHFVSLREAVRAGGAVDVEVSVTGTGKITWHTASSFYVPWSSALGEPPMRITGTYEPETVAVGEAVVATFEVLNHGETIETGDMPMVEIAIPPGFDADLTALDLQVAEDANVARYDRKGDVIIVYLHHLHPGIIYSLQVPMAPRYPMAIKTPAARAYPFFAPQDESRSRPTLLTVTE